MTPPQAPEKCEHETWDDASDDPYTTVVTSLLKEQPGGAIQCGACGKRWVPADVLEELARFADQMAENWAGMTASFVMDGRSAADIANCRGVMEGSLTFAAKVRALIDRTLGGK